MEEAKKKQEAGDNSPPSMVFDIEGSKGSGQILLSEEQMQGSGGTVTLVMSDGSRHDVEMGGAFGADMDDINMDDIDITTGDIDITTGDIEIGEIQEAAAE